MIPRKYRFHSRGGVRYVYQKGKTIRTPVLSLVYTPNELNYQRFGVVISKKILKSAVGRNRIRRRIYEAIRLELADFTVHQDSIFVAFSPTLLEVPFHELRYMIHELLERSQMEQS